MVQGNQGPTRRSVSVIIVESPNSSSIHAVRLPNTKLLMADPISSLLGYTELL